MPRERRAHPRAEVARPCKVYDARAGRYLAGSSLNLSEGGALLDVERGGGLERGDRVGVGFGGPGHGVLSCRHMLGATVLRVGITAAGRRRVAVRFKGG